MLDLNAVAIEQQDADARLLEEPLPFARHAEEKPSEVEPVPEPDCNSVKPVEDAEFAESESQDSHSVDAAEDSGVPKAPELSFEFDQTDEEDEEDLLS